MRQYKLAITTQWAKSVDHKLIIFFYFVFFFHKIGFDISCKLSPKETICMKYQVLFCGGKIKKIFQYSWKHQIVR